MSDDKPFQRDVELNTPGLVGARWWHRGLVEEDLQVTRRSALTGLLTAGAALTAMAVVGGMGYAVLKDDEPEARVVMQASLYAQRAHGWDFGARGESLVYDGDVQLPFDRAALATLEADLVPKTYQALHLPTLLQSPNAVPTMPPIEGEAAFVPLKDVLKPVTTPAMDRAYKVGQGLAAVFRGQGAKTAVIADLPGAESVALGAGAATDLDPVFLFDNWPHPRGVVPAHLPLGAAAYYQPAFVKRRAERAAVASPLFLLDRHRLNPYVDEADRFDNRHVAKLPSASALKALGIERVLYIVPSAISLPELDDLNELFVTYGAEKIDVRATTLDRFSADGAAADAGAADAGTSAPYSGAAPQAFWSDYGWPDTSGSASGSEHGSGSHGATVGYEASPHPAEHELGYRPAARTTGFTHAAAPPHFGAVGVAVAVGTGVVLGSRFNRQGSWKRSSSSSGSSWSFGG